jgi:hypothetical protein
MKNQREFLEVLGQELNFHSLEDWYRFSKPEFLRFRGDGIVRKYGFSLFETLKNVYPEYNWRPWR